MLAKTSALGLFQRDLNHDYRILVPGSTIHRVDGVELAVNDFTLDEGSSYQKAIILSRLRLSQAPIYNPVPGTGAEGYGDFDQTIDVARAYVYGNYIDEPVRMRYSR